jgi:hypothetical protein
VASTTYPRRVSGRTWSVTRRGARTAPVVPGPATATGPSARGAFASGGWFGVPLKNVQTFSRRLVLDGQPGVPLVRRVVATSCRSGPAPRGAGRCRARRPERRDGGCKPTRGARSAQRAATAR